MRYNNITRALLYRKGKSKEISLNQASSPILNRDKKNLLKPMSNLDYINLKLECNSSQSQNNNVFEAEIDNCSNNLEVERRENISNNILDISNIEFSETKDFKSLSLDVVQDILTSKVQDKKQNNVSKLPILAHFETQNLTNAVNANIHEKKDHRRNNAFIRSLSPDIKIGQERNYNISSSDKALTGDRFSQSLPSKIIDKIFDTPHVPPLDLINNTNRKTIRSFSCTVCEKGKSEKPKAVFVNSDLFTKNRIQKGMLTYALSLAKNDALAQKEFASRARQALIQKHKGYLALAKNHQNDTKENHEKIPFGNMYDYLDSDLNNFKPTRCNGKYCAYNIEIGELFYKKKSKDSSKPIMLSLKWQTIILIINSLLIIRRFINEAKMCKFMSKSISICNKYGAMSESDLFISSRLSTLSNYLKNNSRFIDSVHNFNNSKKAKAVKIIKSLFLNFQHNAIVKRRCKELVMKIRLIQRNIKKWLNKKNMVTEFLLTYIDYFVEERVAFNCPTCIDFEKVLHTKNAFSFAVEYQKSGFIEDSEENKDLPEMKVVLEAAYTIIGQFLTSTRFLNGRNIDAMNKFSKGGFFSFPPISLVSEAYHLIISSKNPKKVKISDEMIRFNKNHSSICLKNKYLTREGLEKSHKAIESYEKGKKMKDLAVLVGVAYLPRNVCFYRQNPLMALLFSRETQLLPYAKNMIKKLPKHVKNNLITAYNYLELKNYQKKIKIWREEYYLAKQQLEWQKEYETENLIDLKDKENDLPLFPRRKYYPSPNEMRVLVLAGFYLTLNFNHQMKVSENSMDGMYSSDTLIGQAHIEHKKVLLTKKMFCQEKVCSVLRNFFLKFEKKFTSDEIEKYYDIE